MAHLYFVEGLETTDIAEVLAAEGLLDSVSEESARKTVRTRLSELKLERRESEGEVADDGTQKDRHVARIRYVVRKLVALIEDESTITKVIGVTKDGSPVTSEVPFVAVAVKQKALKDLAVISERWAVVAGVRIGKLESDAKGDRQEVPTEPFQIVMTGNPMDELIQANIGHGKVN